VKRNDPNPLVVDYSGDDGDDDDEEGSGRFDIWRLPDIYNRD